jgi:ribose transport system substrate-binding protein
MSPQNIMKILSSSLKRRYLLAFLAVTAVAGVVEKIPAAGQKPVIPVIVKDTTSSYWQTVFAGARKAGKELNVEIRELGAQAESDVNGQVSVLENAVSEKPAAIVISPTQFSALGKPIDEAAKKAIIIGIDSGADSKGFTAFLQTDNVQGGRVAADGLAEAIKAQYGKADEGVKTGLAASKGEKVEPVIDTGVTLITKENMDSPRSQELLNPKLK